MERESIRALLDKLGGRFSAALGINLDQGDSHEVFKWFLASILYGARISETIANNTYRVFEKNGVLSPDRILETGWDGLVLLLDVGGYVRYDFKTATKLLEVMAALKDSGLWNRALVDVEPTCKVNSKQKGVKIWMWLNLEKKKTATGGL